MQGDGATEAAKDVCRHDSSAVLVRRICAQRIGPGAPALAPEAGPSGEVRDDGLTVPAVGHERPVEQPADVPLTGSRQTRRIEGRDAALGQQVQHPVGVDHGGGPGRRSGRALGRDGGERATTGEQGHTEEHCRAPDASSHRDDPIGVNHRS